MKEHIGELITQIEQLRVQLAGCSVAACGGTSRSQVAKKGVYGWSPAYQDVLDLRREFDKLIEKKNEYKDSTDNGTG